MEKTQLTAAKRTVTGRKVKALRRDGTLPANLYGKKIASLSVQVSEKEFAKVFAKAGETGLVELILDGGKHPVLIHNVQYHSVTSQPLHIDFFQVDLKEKVTAKVPLQLVNEAPAVKDKLGVLLTILSEIEVEALPADLPEKIEVDIGPLTVIDQSVTVGELKVGDKVKILTDPNLEIVKVAPLVSKEAEKLAKEEAEKAAAAAAEVAPVEAAEAKPTPEMPPSSKPEAPPKEPKQG